MDLEQAKTQLEQIQAKKAALEKENQVLRQQVSAKERQLGLVAKAKKRPTPKGFG